MVEILVTSGIMAYSLYALSFKANQSSFSEALVHVV